MATKTPKKRASSKAKAPRTSGKKSGTKTAKSAGASAAGAPRDKVVPPSPPGGTSRPAARKTSSPSAPPPAARVGKTVVVFESGESNRERARNVVTDVGYSASTPQTPDAVSALLSKAPPEVVLVGIPDDGVIDIVKRSDPRPVTVAILPGPATTARARAEQAGADLFVVRPLSNDGVAAALNAAYQLAKARADARAARASENVLRQRLQRYGQADETTGFQHFDFFRQVLVMEIKRAKRYGYSLAACLVAIDPLADDQPTVPDTIRRKLRTRVASAISAAIRDIDIPVDYAEERLLVFLPYTDLKGATSVGKRIASAVKGYGTLADGKRQFSMSVSVGIAAVRPGKPISFARIMREATAAVRAAQLKGGGRIVVRT